MTATLQAAVHQGNDCVDNFLSTKNQPKRTLKQLFNETRKLIKDLKEIRGKPVINWQQQTWQRTTLLTDKAVQLSNAKTQRIFRPSVVYGKDQWKSHQSLEGEDRFVSKFTSTKHWIESMGSRWSSSGQISQDSLHCKSSPRFKT